MNNTISLGFTTKFNQIAEIQNTIFEELRSNLINMGEQSLIFDDGKKVVPIYYINDDNDEGIFHIDKIKTDLEGVIVFHDIDFDEWRRLTYLDNQAINTLIEYIDWK